MAKSAAELWKDDDMINAMEAASKNELTFSKAAHMYLVPRKTPDVCVGYVLHRTEPGKYTGSRVTSSIHGMEDQNESWYNYVFIPMYTNVHGPQIHGCLQLSSSLNGWFSSAMFGDNVPI